jgi:hypothetical protein
MDQTRVKPNHSDIDFNRVAAIADLMVWTGRLPTLDAICEGLHVQSTDEVKQYFELWKARYSSDGAGKTRSTDLSYEFKNLLAESFERRMNALRSRFYAESARIRTDRDRLADMNQQKDAQIEALILVLGEAEVKIADQARLIIRLKQQIADRGR